MARIAIIENSPLAGSYFSRLARAAGAEPSIVPVWRGALFPGAGEFDSCVLTGDWHSVTGGLRGYHRRELEFIRSIGEKRVYASCFAHQLVAADRGGKVSRREGRLLRWERVELSGSHPALGGLERFDAVCLNADEVTRPPDDAVVLGASELCAYQVLSYGENMITCQAHPEMSVRKGSRLVMATALCLGGVTWTRFSEFRRSCPPVWPDDNPFMSRLMCWLNARP